MAGTLAPYLTSCFSQFLFQFTISHSITAFPILIIARIRTCVNKNIRIRTCISMRGEDCESGQHVISDRIPCKSEHLPDGESLGDGDLLFSSPNWNPPPPFHCVRSAYCMEHWYGWPCSPGVRLVYVVQAVHDDITKGRISDPNHAYTFLTALISNQSSEVRVSTAVALYVVFRTVCCVFPVLCGPLLREWTNIHPRTYGQKKESTCRAAGALLVCSE